MHVVTHCIVSPLDLIYLFYYNIYMFIKKVFKTNGKSKKKYQYLHLVESLRTENGPRQKLILNLGKLDIHKSQFTTLAKRIESILTGQKMLFDIDEKLEKHAQNASLKIFKKQAKEINKYKENNYKEIDLSTLEATEARTIGPEYICHNIWKDLGFDNILLDNGIDEKSLPIFESVILGRLIKPGSELSTIRWLNNNSALFELIGNPNVKSNDPYYDKTDKILELKESFEKSLNDNEKTLFNLEEKIFFLDLTNTFFEGKCESSKGAFGRSKEKRSDCRLETLALIIDEDGCAKYSKLYPGNQSEPKVLIEMIKDLENKVSLDKEKTIVIDAGIATEENLKWLRENNYKYIAVKRNKKKPNTDEAGEFKIIKVDESKDIKIEVKRYEKENEVFIYCKSNLKKKKEESIRNRIEQLFIDKLKYYKDGLKKLGHTKKYEKIIEVVGRLKEKYPKVAKLYKVEVIPEEGANIANKKTKAIDIVWEKRELPYAEQLEHEGSYILRSNRLDLEDEEIWNTYNMLRNIEGAFKNMKSHLGLRPNFHQKEKRIDAHMFISVLAYHIQHAIEKKLRLKGDNRTWPTIKDILETHEMITIEFKTNEENGEVKNNYLRIPTKPEFEHMVIYKELGLDGYPIRAKHLKV